MPRQELADLWGEAVRDWEETRPGWGGRPHGACSSHKGILFNSGRSGEPLKNSSVLRSSSSFQCRCPGSPYLRTPVELMS